MSRPDDPFAAVDLDAFLADVRALRREIDANLGPEDLAHLRKIERWGRAATAVGVLTAGVCPNPLSAIALSLGRSTRWLMMHHVGHRGYDRVPEVPARYTSKVFARGARRFVDWFDWMLPEAWIYEHNVLHHSHTGEERDPDLIERNTETLRAAGHSLPVRYGFMALLAFTWRASYYAPSTLRLYRERHAGGDATPETTRERGHERELWLECYLPYMALHFGAFPLLFAPFGPWAAFSALCNSLAAEALTNLHTFCVVGPNHTGDDLYRFDHKPASRGEYYARQVVGSVNFACGTELTDYLHLWLNYQIEHHLFPDVPMLKYRAVQPKVKALCEKHGLPYVQENVFTRVRKMVDVAVGLASMRRAAPTTVARGNTAATALVAEPA